MPENKPGRRTGAILRLIMDDYGLSRADIAEMTSSTESTVDKWLSGANRMQDHTIRILTGSLNLPESVFSRSVKDLEIRDSDSLSDQSVIIKNTTGFQIIVNLTHSQLRQLVHTASALALDHALSSSAGDPPTDSAPPDS